MKNFFLFLLFSASISLLSCKVKQNSSTKEKEEVKKVIIDAAREIAEAKQKSYSINSFSIQGDTLILDVTYTGGCGQNTFQLYSNGLLMKSLPPQINVYLEHSIESETCKKEIKRTLKFDISPLRKPGNPKIILNINTADNKAEWRLQ